MAFEICHHLVPTCPPLSKTNANPPSSCFRYIEDMYVHTDLALDTAKKIKGCKVFTTNVMFHDAIRSRMDEVVKQAFALRDDVFD